MNDVARGNCNHFVKARRESIQPLRSCNICSTYIKKRYAENQIYIIRLLEQEFTGACGSYRLTTCAGRAVLIGDGPFILCDEFRYWHKQKGERSDDLSPLICSGCYIHRGSQERRWLRYTEVTTALGCWNVRKLIAALPTYTFTNNA
jgi:hypothetical protein